MDQCIHAGQPCLYDIYAEECMHLYEGFDCDKRCFEYTTEGFTTERITTENEDLWTTEEMTTMGQDWTTAPRGKTRS